MKPWYQAVIETTKKAPRKWTRFSWLLDEALIPWLRPGGSHYWFRPLDGRRFLCRGFKHYGVALHNSPGNFYLLNKAFVDNVYWRLLAMHQIVPSGLYLTVVPLQPRDKWIKTKSLSYIGFMTCGNKHTRRQTCVRARAYTHRWIPHEELGPWNSIIRKPNWRLSHLFNLFNMIWKAWTSKIKWF